MSDRESFRARLTDAMADVPRTSSGIPLLDVAQLDLKDAQAAALISALADIIEAPCVIPCDVPTMHATAA